MHKYSFEIRRLLGRPRDFGNLDGTPTEKMSVQHSLKMDAGHDVKIIVICVDTRLRIAPYELSRLSCLTHSHPATRRWSRSLLDLTRPLV